MIMLNKKLSLSLSFHCHNPTTVGGMLAFKLYIILMFLQVLLYKYPLTPGY